ncbi:MAG: DUF4314 domain-containing protein [Lachnospiraceae bacterium]|nr:DUF4314 domain-containing protein [Lachnospiraceae bacterium]
MKVTHVYLEDEAVLVPGHLIRRAFHRSIFYPFDNRCGYSSQYITKETKLVAFNRDAYRAFYQEKYPTGTRVAVMEVKSLGRTVEYGTMVTVDRVDDQCFIHCFSDQGRYIRLEPGVDTFRRQDEEQFVQ